MAMPSRVLMPRTMWRRRWLRSMGKRMVPKESTRAHDGHWSQLKRCTTRFPAMTAMNLGRACKFSAYRWLHLALLILTGTTNPMGVIGCQKESITIRATPHSMSARNLVPLQTPPWISIRCLVNRTAVQASTGTKE